MTTTVIILLTLTLWKIFRTELLVVIVDRESQRLLEQSEVTQLVEVNRQQQEKLPSMFDQIGGAQVK